MSTMDSFSLVRALLDARPAPLGVRFEAGPVGVPSIHYGAAPVPYRPPTQIDACAEWLTRLLRAAGEPLRPQDVVTAAATAGFRRWVVYQARQRLKSAIVDTENAHSSHNRWRWVAEPSSENGG